MNLLNGVNDVLKKAQIVSASNELSSLTNSGKQVFIDNAVQSWNEAVDQLYSKSKIMRPKQATEDQLILTTNVRTYSLPDDLVQIRWPLHDETNGRYISQYPGGYEELRNIQTQPANYTGQPLRGAISPIDGELYLEFIPTSGYNGDSYTFLYWHDTGLSRANDLFPFNDTVYRAMVPVVTELWRYNQNQGGNDGVSKVNYGRAIRVLKQEPGQTAWIKRYGGHHTSSSLGFDPLSED